MPKYGKSAQIQSNVTISLYFCFFVCPEEHVLGIIN